MITFQRLLADHPRLGEPIRDAFVRTGIGILGTIRRDGSPRVSPIEVAVVEERLWVGMMPGSRKWQDVTRDPRVSLLTPVADREDLGGEGKLHGALSPVEDPAEAVRILRLAAAAAGFDADDLVGSPMFEVLVGSAAWQRVEDGCWTTRSWSEGRGEVLRRRVGATAEVEELPLLSESEA